MRVIVALVGAGISIILACGAAGQDAPERPLTCAVSESREAYAGQTVTLTGHLVTDFHHGSGITNAACPDAYVPIGRGLPDFGGEQEYFEAWYAARSCADEPLYFSVTGEIQEQTDRGRSYLAMAPQAIFDIHRADGSTCPMTLEALSHRQENSE